MNCVLVWFCAFDEGLKGALINHIIFARLEFLKG
jgi:hypothetical protein